MNYLNYFYWGYGYFYRPYNYYSWHNHCWNSHYNQYAWYSDFYDHHHDHSNHAINNSGNYGHRVTTPTGGTTGVIHRENGSKPNVQSITYNKPNRVNNKPIQTSNTYNYSKPPQSNRPIYNTDEYDAKPNFNRPANKPSYNQTTKPINTSKPIIIKPAIRSSNSTPIRRK